jgi:hypothetical protein
MFFSASEKKVREELIVVFIFWHRPKKRNKKTLALGKITYPSSARILNFKNSLPLRFISNSSKFL